MESHDGAELSGPDTGIERAWRDGLTTLIDLAAGGTPVDLEFAYTLSALAKLVLTAHEVYLPKPKLAVEGPGGVQASFDFRGAKNRTAAGAGVVVGASPDNTAVVYCDGADMLAIRAGTAGGGVGAGALIELGDTSIAPRSIAVALANPGAEPGDTSGWSTTGTWEAGTVEGTIAAPHGGSYYFSATGGTDPAILEQTVDLIAQGFTAAELDSGAIFDAGVWAASEYQSDTGELKLQFLDAAGADVGSVFTTGEFGPNDGTWVEQTLTGDVPVGARQVRVQLLAHNHFGSNTTYGFDDLALSISVRRPVTGIRIIETDGGPQRVVITSEGMAAIGVAPDDEERPTTAAGNAALDDYPTRGTPADQGAWAARRDDMDRDSQADALVPDTAPRLAESDAPAVETPAPTTEADGAATPAKSKPAKRKGKAKAAKAAPAATEPEAAAGSAPTAKPTPRAGTKQAKMIEMLRRPEGATVEQIAAATGWQHHTIRGAISGALKKKLGLTVEAIRIREVGPNKTGAKGSSTVYRIVS